MAASAQKNIKNFQNYNYSISPPGDYALCVSKAEMGAYFSDTHTQTHTRVLSEWPEADKEGWDTKSFTTHFQTGWVMASGRESIAGGEALSKLSADKHHVTVDGF